MSFENILIALATIFILSLLVTVINNSRDDKKWKKSAEEKKHELEKLKLDHALKLKEAELREETKRLLDQKEREILLSKVKCDFEVYGHTDGAAVLKWEIIENPANVEYQIRVWRTRNKKAREVQVDEESSKLIVSNSEQKGSFRDTATRRKSGDYYYYFHLLFDGTRYFSIEELLTVNAEMHRKMDYMKREGKYREAKKEFIKKTGDLYGAERDALKQFRKMAEETINVREIAEEAGIEPMIPRTRGIVKKIKLNDDIKDAIAKDIEATSKYIEKKTTTKSDAEGKLRAAFDRIKTNPRIGREQKLAAYKMACDEYAKKDYVIEHEINVGRILEEVDERGYYELNDDDIDYDEV